MKPIQNLLTVVLLAVFSVNCFAQTESSKAISAQEIEGLIWYTLEDAQKKAKETGKKVVIFGLADWCTFCRKMDREVYTNVKVIQTINENYFRVRLNGESEDLVKFNGKTMKASELAYQLRLTSYPTHYFVQPDGEIIAAQPGYLPSDVYDPLLEYVGKDLFGKVSFEDFLIEKGIEIPEN